MVSFPASLIGWGVAVVGARKVRFLGTLSLDDSFDFFFSLGSCILELSGLFLVQWGMDSVIFSFYFHFVMDFCFEIHLFRSISVHALS